MRYKIDIWQYHSVVDNYESDDIESILKYFRSRWYYIYDYGMCSFTVYEGERELSFDELYDLGFYD